jgi:hypothetical protein
MDVVGSLGVSVSHSTFTGSIQGACEAEFYARQLQAFFDLLDLTDNNGVPLYLALISYDNLVILRFALARVRLLFTTATPTLPCIALAIEREGLRSDVDRPPTIPALNDANWAAVMAAVRAGKFDLKQFLPDGEVSGPAHLRDFTTLGLLPASSTSHEQQTQYHASFRELCSKEQNGKPYETIFTLDPEFTRCRAKERYFYSHLAPYDIQVPAALHSEKHLGEYVVQDIMFLFEVWHPFVELTKTKPSVFIEKKLYRMLEALVTDEQRASIARGEVYQISEAGRKEQTWRGPCSSARGQGTASASASAAGNEGGGGEDDDDDDDDDIDDDYRNAQSSGPSATTQQPAGTTGQQPEADDDEDDEEVFESLKRRAAVSSGRRGAKRAPPPRAPAPAPAAPAAPAAPDDPSAARRKHIQTSAVLLSFCKAIYDNRKDYEDRVAHAYATKEKGRGKLKFSVPTELQVVIDQFSKVVALGRLNFQRTRYLLTLLRFAVNETEATLEEWEANGYTRMLKRMLLDDNGPLAISVDPFVAFTSDGNIRPYLELFPQMAKVYAGKEVNTPLTMVECLWQNANIANWMAHRPDVFIPIRKHSRHMHDSFIEYSNSVDSRNFKSTQALTHSAMRSCHIDGFMRHGVKISSRTTVCSVWVQRRSVALTRFQTLTTI